MVISTEIREDNLQPFLERVSTLIGYAFDAWDWDAIRFGIQDTHRQSEAWYTYDLGSSPTVKIGLARSEDTAKLAVQVEAEEPILARIEAVALIMQIVSSNISPQEVIHLVETAFPDRDYPGDDQMIACDAEHLSVCTECQEALDYFRGKRWQDLLHDTDTLPRYYGGLALLAPEARCFFLPAYVAMALQNKDRELLEIVLEEGKDQDWSLLQEELRAFVINWAKLNDTLDYV
jgi:hypothetical protein